tara:strand:+ start:1551 stop:2363 length:813 start_codon:yes stop_codon:yes gene_type:complete
MSIKQNGGVFGRNPTFNDVTIEGQLTFDGDIDINSDLSVDGDLDVTGFVTSEGLIHNGDSNTYVKFLPDRIYMDVGGQRRIDLEVNSTKVVNNGVVKLQTGSTLTDGLVIDTNQDVSIPNGNIEMGNGYGIDFSATGTGTSELLDDYEEGEFAVTLTPSTSGSIALQAGADTMLYNKVGRVVHCQGQINVSSIASAVGSSIAVNLPFAKLNTTDGSEASSGPVTYYNTSAYSVLPAYVPGSATQAFNIVIDPSTLANAHAFYIQFSYTAA